MADAVQLGHGICLTNEGVVLWRRAIAVEAYNAAQMVSGVLRLLTVVKAVAQSQQQGVVRQKGDASAVVGAALLGRLHAEDLVRVLQRFAVEGRRRQAGVASLAGAAAVAEEQLTGLGKIRRQRDFHQTALAVDECLGHARNRLRAQLACGINQSQLAATLGDQHAAVRQKSQRPGVGQAVSQGFNLIVGCRDSAGTEQQRAAQQSKLVHCLSPCTINRARADRAAPWVWSSGQTVHYPGPQPPSMTADRVFRE